MSRLVEAHPTFPRATSHFAAHHHIVHNMRCHTDYASKPWLMPCIETQPKAQPRTLPVALRSHASTWSHLQHLCPSSPDDDAHQVLLLLHTEVLTEQRPQLCLLSPTQHSTAWHTVSCPTSTRAAIGCTAAALTKQSTNSHPVCVLYAEGKNNSPVCGDRESPHTATVRDKSLGS
jgi:hypothetical protein